MCVATWGFIKIKVQAHIDETEVKYFFRSTPNRISVTKKQRNVPPTKTNEANGHGLER
jgi:hypothetical protein